MLPPVVLARAMAWLSLPLRFTFGDNETSTAAAAGADPWILSTCNWYNDWKVPLLVQAARRYPRSPLLIAGGLGRLASAGSRRHGAEAYEMQRLLLDAGLAGDRITAIGCRECGVGDSRGNVSAISCDCVGNTGFNIDQMLQRIAASAVPGQQMAVVVVEESFLARRVFATLLNRVRVHNEFGAAIPLLSSIELWPTVRSLAVLQRRHSEEQASTLIAGEVDRLRRYSEGPALRLFRRRDFLRTFGDMLTFRRLLRRIQLGSSASQALLAGPAKRTKRTKTKAQAHAVEL